MEIKDKGTGLVHDKVPELATCMLPKMSHQWDVGTNV